MTGMDLKAGKGPWRDAHLHLAEHGMELACLSLADCGSLAHALQRILKRAQDAPDESAWIKATGARPEAWPERRLPNAGELRDASGGRPVMVLSFDHHAMSVSTRVLEMAGVSRETPGLYRSSTGFGGGTGTIEKDERTGEPTGVLIEAACEIARALEPPVTIEHRAGFIRSAQRDLRGLGIVEVHDMFATPDLVRALAMLEASGELELRIVLFAPPTHLDGVIDAMRATPRSDRVTLGGLKLFTDGTLNSRTASMLAPYASPHAPPPSPPHTPPDHPRGTPFLTDDELLGHMRAMRARGLDIAAHAIGDAAVRRLLDLWSSFDDIADSTLRIEHAQFVDESDIPRFADPRRRVIASMQPCHLLADIEAIRHLTPHRAARAFPLRDLADACACAGVDPAQRILLGSDTPVVRPDPADNLQAAVYRRRPGMGEHEAISPEQAITPEQCAALMRAKV